MVVNLIVISIKSKAAVFNLREFYAVGVSVKGWLWLCDWLVTSQGCITPLTQDSWDRTATHDPWMDENNVT